MESHGVPRVSSDSAHSSAPQNLFMARRGRFARAPDGEGADPWWRQMP